MYEFSVVYDIFNEGYTQWRFFTPVFLFIVIGIIFWKMPIIGALARSRGESAKSFWRTFTFVSVAMVLGGIPLTYSIYNRAVEHYTKGDYEIIEGIVETYEDPGENVTIRGYRIGNTNLWRRNLPMSPEFLQPGLKKIPLAEGVYMRVAIADGIFLKVEIANKSSHSPH